MSRWLRLRVVADRAVATILLALTWPVLAVLAVWVRRHDGGPAFVSVPRVGTDGRPFGMWKLRSMRVDGSDGRANGPSLTSGADDRITSVGVRLRAWYLDELPQLYNVVRGQMGLLGPRPEAPEFVDLDDPRWQEVLQTPPGMAGPTQLVVNDWERERITASPDGSAYRTDVLPVKLAIDAWYTRRASPRLDLYVATALVGRLIPGSTAEPLCRRVRRQVPEAAMVPVRWGRGLPGDRETVTGNVGTPRWGSAGPRDDRTSR